MEKSSNNEFARVTPPACKTCQHWDQRYPKNQQLGICRRIGVLLWKDGREASISITTNDEPTSDVEAVRTLDTFGCRLHSDYVMMRLSGTL